MPATSIVSTSWARGDLPWKIGARANANLRQGPLVKAGPGEGVLDAIASVLQARIDEDFRTGTRRYGNPPFESRTNAF